MKKVTVADLEKHTQSLLNRAERILGSGNTEEVPVGLPLVVQVLRYLAELIASGNLSEEVLGKQAFGIFRIVTDDGAFEESAIGKDLLQLSAELREVDLSRS